MASTTESQSTPKEARVERPSFMKSVFEGVIEAPLIHPYPEISADERETLDLVRDTFMRFASENIDAVRFDREGHYPRETIQGLAEIGMLGLFVPEEYGGLGMSQSAYCRLIEVMSSIDASTAVTVGAHLSIGMKDIVIVRLI